MSIRLKRCPKCGTVDIKKLDDILLKWNKNNIPNEMLYQCNECEHIWSTDKDTIFGNTDEIIF